MNKFAKTRISLAVAAALTLTGITVAYAAAPANRALNPTLVSTLGTLSDANKRALLSATGLSAVSVSVTANLDSAVAVTTTADDMNGVIRAVAANAAGVVLASGSTLVTGNATLTANNVNAYTGILSATTTLIPTGNTTAATIVYGANTTGNGASSAVVVLPAAVAPAAYRVNAGNLQFTTNNGTTGGTAVAFADVKIDVQSAANGSTAAGDIQIYTETNATAGFTAGTDLVIATTQTAATTKNSLAPTPTASTTSAAGAALINGFSIDTGTPITLTSAVTNINVATRAAGAVTVAAAIPPAAIPSVTCALSKCAVVLGLGGAGTAGVDLVAPTNLTTDAADVAAYASTSFNTGINGATVPFTVDGGVVATAPTYTEVFNVSDGAAAKLVRFADAGAAGSSAAFANPATAIITDGAQVVVVSAAESAGLAAGTSDVALTFSELMVSLGTNAQALREVAENVLIGTNSLAALNLNAGGILALTGPADANGQSTFTITGVQTADLVGTLNVNTGIALVEPNDPLFIAAVAAGTTTVLLDTFAAGAANEGPNAVNLTGGIAATTGDTVALKAPSTTTGLTVAPTPIGIAFGEATNSDTDTGGDTSASAATTVADPTKVGSITVDFNGTNKAVMLNTAPVKTLADLAPQIVVTVNGVAGNDPAQFQFHPTVAQLAIATDGSSLTITLPTDLIYANMDAVTTMKVEYLDGATNMVLVNKNASGSQAIGSIVVSTAGAEPVVLPPAALTASATEKTLMTQSIRGTLTGQSNGSRVKAWLAKWKENPGSADSTVAIKGGKVSRAKDDVVNQLAIEFVDQGVLEGLIADQVNAVAAALPAIAGVRAAEPAAKAAPIRVYAALTRSNEPRANASTGDTLKATVELASTLAGATGARNNANDPVYELTLDAITGKLTGALNGELSLKVTKGTTAPGLTLFDSDPVTAGIQGNPVAVGMVDNVTGKFDLLAGIDSVDTEDLSQGLKAFADQFLILVHQDQNNARTFTQLTSANPGNVNFLPFEPNLASLKGTRTVLGVKPGIAGPIPPLALPASAETIDLAQYVVNKKDQTKTAWFIVGLRNPAFAAVPGPGASFARDLVGLTADGASGDNGKPISAWAGDGGGDDMAMTMINNKVFLATELGVDKGTLSTITKLSFTLGAAALALKNDGAPNAAGAGTPVDTVTDVVSFHTAQGVAVPSPAVGIGWSLVAAPSATLNATTVEAIIRVGAQAASQFTFLKGDVGGQPALTVGEGVFVFSKGGGKLLP